MCLRAADVSCRVYLQPGERRYVPLFVYAHVSELRCLFTALPLHSPTKRLHTGARFTHARIMDTRAPRRRPSHAPNADTDASQIYTRCACHMIDAERCTDNTTCALLYRPPHLPLHDPARPCPLLELPNRTRSTMARPNGTARRHPVQSNRLEAMMDIP